MQQDSQQDSLDKMKVVHYVSRWLPQTAAWLFNEVRFLPAETIESHIVCNETWGLDQFPMDHIHAMQQLPFWKRYWLRIQRKLKLIDPDNLHLSLLERVCQRLKPGILHSHFGHMGWVNSRLARKY